MQTFTLLDQAVDIPEPADPELAALGFAKWRDAVAGLEDNDAEQCRRIKSSSPGHAILSAIFGNSPFLSQILVRNPKAFVRIVREGPDSCFRDVLAANTHVGDLTDAQLMTQLRQRRNEVALLIGTADIANVWELDTVTGSLSAFAESVIHQTANHLISSAIKSGQLGGSDSQAPAETSGFAIIGMGKLGAAELNYSSDIDLVVLYDEDRIEYCGTDHPQALFVDLTKRLVKILQDRTVQGYVFRTDLRLRPDPGATPPALSMAAAERYYESVGQNWERAAFIKARAIGGDLDAGVRFLERIAPFIWRKHLDYAAITDIHSIKRQITAHRGHAKTAVAGHDIKLGRGGIREIEFFVQTQQLIAGGKDFTLRTGKTLVGLDALARSGRIEQHVADDLATSYCYLRRLEHRLQMINDEQTHTLPADESKLKNLAVFLGTSLPDFRNELKKQLDTVVGHYARLFEREDPLGGEGSLVFTGSTDDPETLETLRSLGFRQPTRISKRIRDWHHGRFAATRAIRARELLTQLMPRLLEALSLTADPDAAFVKFDEFLSRLPAGVQLFSLFNENPTLLDLVAEIMGTAPRLANALSHNATMFDAVLSSDFFDPLPGKGKLLHHLNEAMVGARDYEDVLDIARRWANEQKFRAGVQILRNASSAADMGPDLSNLADTLITRLIDDATAQLAEQHGTISGGSFAVVGLGKLGACEMTPESDLDLVFVYDFDADHPVSDGPRPLPASLYYTRLSQRLISALTALTGEGRLYEVDMRLRPTGNAGAVASHLDGFVRYQRETAWTWEHMALTRARVVAAPPELSDRTERALENVLKIPRDHAQLKQEINEMRNRVEKEHATADPWNVKYVRGGLIDLQFLCQYLQLAHAKQLPYVIGGSTESVFTRMATSDVIEGTQALEMGMAAKLMINIQGLLRLTLSDAFNESEAPDALREALARAGGTEDLASLRNTLIDTQGRVLETYRQHIEPSAALA